MFAGKYISTAYLWMAAGVVVVQGHTDQGRKGKPGLRKFFSSSDSSDLRPISGMNILDIAGFLGNSYADGRPRQAGESLRQVMYLNGWG